MPAAHSLSASNIQDHASAIVFFALNSLGALKAPFFIRGDHVIGEGDRAVSKSIFINCGFSFMC